MSPKEEIEKLRKDCADWGDHTNGEVQAVIDRAVSLGGKFVRDRVEEASKKHDDDRTHTGDCFCAMFQIAASQALSELEVDRTQKKG